MAGSVEVNLNINVGSPIPRSVENFQAGDTITVNTAITSADSSGITFTNNGTTARIAFNNYFGETPTNVTVQRTSTGQSVITAGGATPPPPPSTVAAGTTWTVSGATTVANLVNNGAIVIGGGASLKVTSRLVEGSGSTITGIVTGAGAGTTIELAQGKSGSIATGLSNIGTIAVDAGASWTVTGSYSLPNIVNNGSIVVGSGASLQVTSRLMEGAGRSSRVSSAAPVRARRSSWRRASRAASPRACRISARSRSTPGRAGR